MRPPNLIRIRNRRKGEPWSPKEFLKKWFTENLSLKAFAIVMAVVMWGFVATQRSGEISEWRFTRPLVLKNTPANMDVIDLPVQSVGLWVRLAPSQRRTFNSSDFEVSIDLANLGPGPVQYILGEENLTYNNQPPPKGIQVYQIQPSVLNFRLEELIEKEMLIRHRYSGNTAKGFTIESIRIEPPRVKVRGARSRLEKLTTIYTKPLEIHELENNIGLLVVLDLSPDLRLVGEKKDYMAFIEVSQNVSRLLIRDIPVRAENVNLAYRTSTKTVNVFLEGPESIMNSLNKDNVFAVLDLAKYPPGNHPKQTPKVVVPETVKVLEQWPIVDLLVLGRPANKSG
ncbi:MAG: CdaR family protein [bacterium]